MRLFLPKDTEKPEEQNKAKESGALTLLLGKNNQIFYYEGILDPAGANFKSTNFKDIRDVVIDKKKRTRPEDFVVVIKPGPESKFVNTVDILDEMTISEIKRYALVDIADAELQLVRATEGAAGN
jgi:hypothetical protein